jgi:hypothetical protein
MHQYGMTLSKSDFILFLLCPESFWLSKHEPDAAPRGEFSDFQQKLVRDGYEVEAYVRQLFTDTTGIEFQRTFESSSGLLARADVFETSEDGRTHLYEVKSSTRVKTDAKHNHLKDGCFQVIAAERSGQSIDRVSIIHLNGKYVRDGEIDPAQLLTVTDVTDLVRAMQEDTEREIDRALNLLNESDIDRSACSCLRKTRSNHCDSFSYFNPGVPLPSIYSLPNIRANKIDELVNAGIFDLTALPDDLKLSEPQTALLQAVRTGKPVIGSVAIREFLDNLEFPLWFFDFETYSSAVPIIDGTNPHRHIPIQYSLHILQADGTLGHKEYLSPVAQLPEELIQQMRSDIGPDGHIVSWHASFEKTQNKTMAELFPDHEEFLIGINDRMVDLEDLFKSAYVDARFDGSSSIKRVLPVVCPHLSYDGMEVADGTAAMEAWARMIHPDTSQSEKTALNASLREYCKLDTLAMIEIYRFLRELTNTTSAAD